MASSSSLRGWTAVGAALVLALIPAATAASRDRSTWGQILIGGGACEEFGPFDDAKLYDPAANRFANTTMKSARGGATATLIPSGRDAGKILISGGYRYLLDMLDKYQDLASTELYDPATNSFKRGPAMRAARAYHTATVLTAGPHAGEVLIAGGEASRDHEGYLFLTSTELYDPVTRRFASGPSLHTGRLGNTATPIVAGPNKGKILIAGGVDNNHNPLAATEFYDPSSNRFEPGPSMNVPRSNHTAATIVAGGSSGRILFAGGYSTSDSHPLATTELFDPVTNRFVPGPTMQTARESHTATVLKAGANAGKILIAGGSSDSEGLASTELYDPQRNAFAPGPSMNYARYGHTATDIGWGRSAGRILITGRNDYGSIIPSDLYDAATNTFVPAANSPLWRGGCDGTFAIQLPPRP